MSIDSISIVGLLGFFVKTSKGSMLIVQGFISKWVHEVGCLPRTFVGCGLRWDVGDGGILTKMRF